MKQFPTAELLTAPSASRPSLARRAVAFILCLSVVFWSLGGVQLLKWAWPINEADLKPTAGPFSWNTIPTTKKISLKPCYGDKRCTRVELPLDYFNGTTDRKISLAVAVVPAKVPITDPRYGGPLLVNPGGPGGSGVELVVEAGHHLQNMVDSPMDPTTSDDDSGAKYYDVVGFDPRGVGHSSPGAHCFEDGSIRESWELRLDAQGILGSSDAVLGQRWSMVNALGHNCAATANDFDVKRYVTTASVARDMLELAELFGQHREQESRRLVQHSARCQRRPPSVTPYVYEPGAEKVQYWGFSYGTLIGSTFASMYPERVGRLVLDGVVNGANYMAALWSDNLLDTEKEMGLFYSRCAEGGPSACELATPNATAADIEATVADILDNLYHNPLSVEHELFPEVVTWSDVRLFMFMSLYGPMEGFPAMAKMLHTLRQADASARMSEYLSSKHFYACAMPPGGGSDSGNQTQGAPVDGEALQSISCSDGEPLDDSTVDDFDVFWRNLDAVSPTAGAMWARHRMNCAGWRIRPVHRFEGPFGGETAEPILWIGNTADPVTPVFNAHKMSSLFPRSVVLTQNSPGHASLAAYSPCTVAALRGYLHNATLPAPGTLCEPVEIPFVKPRRAGGEGRTPWASSSASSSVSRREQEERDDAADLRQLLETDAAVRTAAADVTGWDLNEMVRMGVAFRRVSRAWGRGRNGLGAKGLGRGVFAL
ncbi:TAP-like protein-domain-containing protein [Phyllosticta capitalensis]